MSVVLVGEQNVWRAAAVPTDTFRHVDDPHTEHESKPVRLGNRALELMEATVYVVIAVLLFVLAMSLLWAGVQSVPDLFATKADSDATLIALDTLLLVFIVVELLYAVRMTLVKRELVAEPFLLVGIIASIKEIIVLSVKAAEEVGKGRAFTDAILEIAVLGLLVFLLGVTTWLMRLKERHPDESSGEHDD